jgi:ribosomal-protein-alanine N-acetyltransferase
VITVTFQVVKLTELQCKEICTWIYSVPYEIYNWPSWAIMVAEGLQFGDPEIREAQYAAVVQVKEGEAELIGYAQYFPMQDVTRLGIGLRPDLCDQGLGSLFIQAIINEAHVRNPNHEIDLEVHTWNERAQKTYEKVGFVKTDEYERMTPTGVGLFYCMVYRPNSLD